MGKESPLCQEIGPKKFRERVEKADKEYDKKVGKTINGIFHHGVSYSDPNKKTQLGRYCGEVECMSGCGKSLSITTSTCVIICSFCKTYHSIQKTEDGFEIEAPYLKKESDDGSTGE